MTDTTTNIQDEPWDINSFEAAVASCAAAGEPLEISSDDLAKTVCRGGFNGKPYFIYKNVRVYKRGVRERAEAEESLSVGQKLHADYIKLDNQ